MTRPRISAGAFSCTNDCAIELNAELDEAGHEQQGDGDGVGMRSREADQRAAPDDRQDEGGAHALAAANRGSPKSIRRIKPPAASAASSMHVDKSEARACPRSSGEAWHLRLIGIADEESAMRRPARSWTAAPGCARTTFMVDHISGNPRMPLRPRHTHAIRARRAP